MNYQISNCIQGQRGQIKSVVDLRLSDKRGYEVTNSSRYELCCDFRWRLLPHVLPAVLSNAAAVSRLVLPTPLVFAFPSASAALLPQICAALSKVRLSLSKHITIFLSRVIRLCCSLCQYSCALSY